MKHEEGFKGSTIASIHSILCLWYKILYGIDLDNAGKVGSKMISNWKKEEFIKQAKVCLEI